MKIQFVTDKVSVEEQYDVLKHEFDIMTTFHHPFIGNASYLFKDLHRVYMASTLKIPFETFLFAKGALNEDDVSFYMAEIILVLEHLHNKDVAHRDIKVDNILMGKDGHLQLIDFGLMFMKHKCKKDGEKENLNCLIKENYIPCQSYCPDEASFKVALNHDLIMAGNLLKVMLGIYGDFQTVMYGRWPYLGDYEIRPLYTKDAGFYFLKLNESK